MKAIFGGGVAVCLSCIVSAAAGAVVVRGGSVDSRPGSTVSVPVTLLTSGSLVRGVISEFEVTTSTPLESCVLNPLFVDLGTIVLKPDNCEVDINCLSARAVLLQFSEAPIPDGTQLYACSFKVATNAQGAYEVTCKEASSSDPSGIELPTTCDSGVISVSRTAACAGDCNDDGEVFGNEVTIAINIVAGTEELATCTNADLDGDGEVFGNEVTIAINNVANGCAE